MPIRRLFRHALRSRRWPPSARLAGVALLVLAAFALRAGVWGIRPMLPFITFFPMLLAATAIFGRAAGWVALAASVVLADFFFLAPIHSFDLGAGAFAAILLFVAGGGFIVEETHALQAAYAEIERTQARLEVALHLAETRRREAEAKERALDLLMQESTHRMKNDLARLSAMMRMQAAGGTAETRHALAEAASRVLVLARMHDRLSRRDAEVLVDARALLQDIVDAIGATAPDARAVGLLVETPSLLLPAAVAGPLGLIANEWLTNALKHAFPGNTPGTVHAHLRADGEYLVLEVTDTGVGLEPCGAGADQAPQPGGCPEAGHQDTGRQDPGRQGIGWRLVAALATQIGGSVETVAGASGGTTQTLRFPTTPLTGLAPPDAAVA